MGWNDFVLVGRVGRPNGLRGHVFLNVDTDFADDRFAPGATVWARPDGQPDAITLTVASFRWQGSRPVVSFEGLDSIEAIEPLAGCELRVPEDALLPLPDGRYYHHQLVGCTVVSVTGEVVGVVTRIDGGVAGSLLAVEGPKGEILIPLADDICKSVDVDAKRITVDPPDGLIDLNERDERTARTTRTFRTFRTKQ